MAARRLGRPGRERAVQVVATQVVAVIAAGATAVEVAAAAGAECAAPVDVGVGAASPEVVSA